MSLQHTSLNATLTPVRVSTAPDIVQYRNIKFASISERLTHSKSINDWNGASIGSEKHGPRCPQVYYDLNTLFRIPAEQAPSWVEPEDEFECLNLHVTVPAGVKAGDNVPVLMWLHGGSLVASCCGAKSGVNDPTKLVAKSVEDGTPIIFVAINYRLGFLGFAHIDDELTNFGLFDQKHAIEWVHRHIHGFGGDASNITLGGESAGAIATHFHTLSAHSSLLKRVILQSGTATTIPAQPVPVGEFFRNKLFAELSVSNIDEFRKLEATEICRAQQAIGVNTIFPVATGSFWSKEPWRGEVLIGDVEKEYSLFTTGITSLSAPAIEFPDVPASKAILDAYGNNLDGVLKFSGDAKFNYHTEMYHREFLRDSPKTYRYLFDAPNPFVPELGAHHAVDLLYLFGGVQLSARQEALGDAMRRIWVRFVAGVEPWNKEGLEKVLVIDADGCRVRDAEEVKKRRNAEQWKVLEELGWEAVSKVIGEVVRGKIRFE